MKQYTNPEIEFTVVDTNDIITTSPGIETSPRDENDGIWDLDIGY